MPYRPKSPCVVHDCPRFATQRSRCPEHYRQWEQQRAKQRGSSTQRGYGYRWQQTSKRAIAQAPYCVDCGTEGTSDNPLTGDHLTPRSKGGTAEDGVVVRCRRCNSKKGNR